ncbi:putative membrane protein [Clostridium bornimense]|uniref:Putative membrane protein n=1 Tax=Clostridium bornimense TaxID=1216932 RepID=W6SJD2_9CLOT|nr:putative membrane protein [Clostridium bornimense]
MIILIKLLVLGCLTGFACALPLNIYISEDIVSNKYPYSNKNIYLSVGALLSNIFLLLFFNTAMTFLFNTNKYIKNSLLILFGILINFFIFIYFTNKTLFNKNQKYPKYFDAFMLGVIKTTTNIFTLFIWLIGSLLYNIMHRYISLHYIFTYYTGLICGISMWFIFLNIIQINKIHIITPASITYIKNILLKFFFILSLLLIMLGIYGLI